MLQHLAKWAVLAALWRRLSPYASGTLIAAMLLTVITLLHAEYTDYLRLRRELSAIAPDANYVVFSFALKWLAYAVVTGAYVVYVVRVSSRTRSAGGRGWGARPGMPSAAQAGSSRVEGKTAPKALPADDPEDQAFDFLRTKKRLRGRGDQLLQRDLDDRS